jgi:phenylacetate-CoA ligase
MRANVQTRVANACLRPVDAVLRLVGATYPVFVWFFRTVPPSALEWLGRQRAIRACDHAARRVPAYRAFLASSQVTAADITRLTVPATDKANYINVFRFDERCLDGVVPMRNVAIDESSGSTGTPYNWVRSQSERRASHLAVSHFARHAFGEGPWITINAFSMGAWATGINMGIALQRNSMVKNTGPDLGKIMGTLEHFGPGYPYLICGYPPFLKRLIDSAEESGFPLKDYQLMALLGGEGNSEGLRDYLGGAFTRVFSGYGATDIEIGIAGETPTSLAIRRAARRDERVREALFGTDSRLPMLFQYNPLMHHIVVNDRGELSFTTTRLSILSPRIMYNIHDEGGVGSYRDIRARLSRAGISLAELEATTGVRPVPLPFLWVYGRKDSTVSVMGANIYPEDVEQCLYNEPDLARVTNSFCLGLREDADGLARPLLSFEVTVEISPELQERFQTRIVTRLVSLNADFREAMKESEKAARPIVALFPLHAGPFAADDGNIKQARIIRTS